MNTYNDTQYKLHRYTQAQRAADLKEFNRPPLVSVLIWGATLTLWFLLIFACIAAIVSPELLVNFIH